MPKYNRFDMSQAIENYIVNSRYRFVLRLKLCEGMTYEEVAEAVGVSRVTVYHHLSQSLQRIKEHFEQAK